jgi:hypothetical protein
MSNTAHTTKQTPTNDLSTFDCPFEAFEAHTVISLPSAKDLTESYNTLCDDIETAKGIGLHPADIYQLKLRRKVVKGLLALLNS